VLWVASEWIIDCAGPLYDAMLDKRGLYRSDEGYIEFVDRAWHGGDLYKGKSMSLDRWVFWKKRISELTAETHDADVLSHLSDALRTMEETEARNTAQVAVASA